MKRLLVVGICISVLAGSAVADTVYETKDALGNPVFSDRPQKGAKKIELKPLNTTPSVLLHPPTNSSSAPADNGGPLQVYKKIELDVPRPIPNGLAPTKVGIDTEPALRPGDQWRLKVDGKTVATGTGNSATIPKVSRGTHTLELEIYNGGGVVATSKPESVFVFWPSKKR